MTPETLRGLRAAGSAHHLAAHGCWALVRHAEVSAALADPVRFSSVGGNGHRPERGSRLLVALDPPEHGVVRHHVARALGGDMVATVERVATDAAAAAVARGVRRGHVDVVADVADPVAVASLAAVLGLRPERLAALRQGHSFPGQPLTARWRRFFEDHVRSASGGNLVTELIDTGVDAEVVVDLCLLLLVAGWDTPRDLIAASLHELVHRGHSLEPVPGLVDELARLVAPVQAVFRTTTVAVDGIPAGARVLLSLASANRDEQAWAAPDDLVLGRPVPHLGFGAGPHRCVGARLARAQLDAVLRTFAEFVLSPLGAPGWSPVPWFRRMRSGQLVVSLPAC